MGRRPRVDVALIAVVLAFVSAEIGVRLIDHPTLEELRTEQRDGYFPPPHVFDETLGYRYKANHDGVFERSDFAVNLTTNGHGWRDSETTVSRTPETWRVALLGSSYLAANQVHLDETWASRLEAELPLVHGRRVELLNFGVDGYRPWNIHQVAVHEVPRYQPDLVVLWSTAPSLALTDEHYRRVDPHDTILEARSIRRLDEAVAQRSARLPTLSEAMPRYLALTRVFNALLGKQVYTNLAFVGGYSATDHDPYALVAGMRDAAASCGAGFAVVYMGNPPESRLQRAFPDGLPHARLGLPAYADGELIPDMAAYRFEHDAHWTPEGNRVYAERTLPMWTRLLEEQLKPE